MPKQNLGKSFSVRPGRQPSLNKQVKVGGGAAKSNARRKAVLSVSEKQDRVVEAAS